MKNSKLKIACGVVVLGITGTTSATILPTTPHGAYNVIPFQSGPSSMHQVFNSNLFGATPINITEIGFAPNIDGTTFLGDLTFRFGYTNAIPGAASASGGLTIPTSFAGGGNSSGPMSLFASETAYSITVTGAGSENFQMRFAGAFVYDPNLGNLLLEIVSNNPDTSSIFGVSRAEALSESSRSFNSSLWGAAEDPTRALRVDFNYEPVPEPATMTILVAGVVGIVSRRRKSK